MILDLMITLRKELVGVLHHPNRLLMVGVPLADGEIMNQQTVVVGVRV